MISFTFSFSLREELVSTTDWIGVYDPNLLPELDDWASSCGYWRDYKYLSGGYYATPKVITEGE
jgi:hypothetical protein